MKRGGGGGVDKEQEFHGRLCCICWGKRDKDIAPLLIKHKILVMGQGVDQLELGFSLRQCLRTNTGF